ncbi:MAG: GTP-binding protein [Anaerolineae bacterium]|nr:GTP-binding protein [Anaerolineae bacterium]
MDILHIATAGSVDDGKSTLIGRLLYETQSVTKDRLEAIHQASKRRGVDFLDLSLLTDGLIAEREQGITIDVAHVYFNTNKRKYIIADTPGHFEYTRNMVTGASRVSVSIILIDARNGIVEQTARHYYISALLRIPKVIVCINKMDLVNNSQARFNSIVADFKRLSENIHNADIAQQLHFIPASSLHGHNLTQPAPEFGWYQGPTLLELLETADTNRPRELAPRFQVQMVIRPRLSATHDAQRATELHDYRGYAGRVSSGTFTVGDEIEVLPNSRRSVISHIDKHGQPVQTASAGESVTLRLADDIDISRGCLIVSPSTAPAAQKTIHARMCWLDHTALSPGKTYILQHGVHTTQSKVTQIHGVLDVLTQNVNRNLPTLKLNEIGDVTLRVAQPIFADRYADNTANGSFILIDEWTNNTVGVGFVA